MSPQFGPIQRKQSFENHERAWIKHQVWRSSSVNRKIVSRNGNGAGPDARSATCAISNSCSSAAGSSKFESALASGRKMGQVAIVMVERQNGRVQFFGQVASQIALPCSGRPSDANEIRTGEPCAHSVNQWLVAVDQRLERCSSPG